MLYFLNHTTKPEPKGIYSVCVVDVCMTDTPRHPSRLFVVEQGCVAVAGTALYNLVAIFFSKTAAWLRLLFLLGISSTIR